MTVIACISVKSQRHVVFCLTDMILHRVQEEETGPFLPYLLGTYGG